MADLIRFERKKNDSQVPTNSVIILSYVDNSELYNLLLLNVC